MDKEIKRDLALAIKNIKYKDVHEFNRKDLEELGYRFKSLYGTVISK